MAFENNMVMSLAIWSCWFCGSLWGPSVALGEELSLKWELPTRELPQAVVVDAEQGVAYVALKEGGVGVLELQADGNAPHFLPNRISKRRLGGLDAMNLFSHQGYLYVALGDFFKKQDHAGIAIIDIRKGTDPKLLSMWKSKDPMEGSAVVVANERRAFLGCMNEGVLVFDIRNKDEARYVTKFQPNVNFPIKNPGRIQHPNARGMALRGKLLYLAYDAGGLRVLNVAQREPVEVARYSNRSMQGKKQQAYNNVLLDGDRAFIAIDYAGVEIVDIRNPRHIKQIGWWNPWNADTGKNLWFNSPGHANQLAFDKKHQLLFFSAGDSELQVLDVRRASRPALAYSYGRPKNGEGVWGVTLSGDVAYLSYIKSFVPFRGSWSGIRAVGKVD